MGTVRSPHARIMRQPGYTPESSRFPDRTRQEYWDEDEWALYRTQLLDPWYSDPDWVPGRDREEDFQRDVRDIQRVEAEVREKGWRL